MTNVTIAHDYRSQEDKLNKKLIYIGLKDPLRDVIIRIAFKEDGTCEDGYVSSIKHEKNLCRCHILPDELVLAFHEQYLIFYDADLKFLYKIIWSDQL